MSYAQARKQARKQSAKTGRPLYIVNDPEWTGDREGWQIATDFDLETFFTGCTEIEEV
jgi:predicted lipoprotein with Yx(FWY)xxD motif